MLSLFPVKVPNPLFDLAGIMCGQFGIPFWKFFTATLIGKAIIKTHIQVCIFKMLSFLFDKIKSITLISREKENAEQKYTRKKEIITDSV